jgi:hypothetical protein
MDDQTEDGGRRSGQGSGGGVVDAAGADVGSDLGPAVGEGDLSGVSRVAEPALVHGLDDADAGGLDFGVFVAGEVDGVGDVLFEGVSKFIEGFLHGLGAHHPEETSERIDWLGQRMLDRVKRHGGLRRHAGC